jgi:oligopeptide transport system substrate-binding protein
MLLVSMIALTLWAAPALADDPAGTARAARAAVPAALPRTGTLRFRLSADPATLDWNLAHTNFETYVIMNLMEGLVEEGPDLRPRPALAERWTISPDGLTYVFQLKKGVKWSDGKPLRAQEFVDSWVRLLSPSTGAEYAHYLFALKNAEAFHQGKLKDLSALGVRAVDDATLEVTLKAPLPYFLHLPTFWVTFPIRLDLVKKHGKDWATPGKIVTLGPYALDSWERGRHLRLVRNGSYHGGASRLSVERTEITIEPNDAEARKLFAAGALDLLLDAPAGAPRALQFPYLSTTYLGFNVNREPLTFVSIRKALATSVRRELIPGVLKGGQVVARGLVPPGIAGHDYGEFHLTAREGEGKAALERLGFGPKHRFPKLHLYMQRADRAEDLTRFLVHDIRENLGIVVEPHVLEQAAYRKLLSEGKADLYIGTWGADFPDPANFFELFQSSSRLNYTGWRNSEFDAQVARGATTMDPTQRARAYSEAERLLLERDVAIYPLFYRRNTVQAGRRLKSLMISPLNYLFIKDVALGD